MAQKKCSVTSCHGHKLLFKLPKNDGLRAHWLKRISFPIDDLNEVYICSKHFSMDRFVSSMGSRSLLPFSIPSILPGAKGMPNCLSQDEIDLYYGSQNENTANGASTSYGSHYDSDVEKIEQLPLFPKVSRFGNIRVRRSACIVPGCDDVNSRRLILPHPRKDHLNRFTQWLKVICSRRLFELDPLRAYKTARICLRHFSPSLFVLGKKENKLLNTAVPDSYLPDENCKHSDYLSARNYLLEVFGSNSQNLKSNNASLGDTLNATNTAPGEIILHEDGPQAVWSKSPAPMNPLSSEAVCDGTANNVKGDAATTKKTHTTHSSDEETISVMTDDQDCTVIEDDLLSLEHSYGAPRAKEARKDVIALDHLYQRKGKEEDLAVKTVEYKRTPGDNTDSSRRKQKTSRVVKTSITYYVCIGGEVLGSTTTEVAQ